MSDKTASSSRGAVFDWIANIIARSVILVALALPHKMRLRWFGWMVAKLVAPIAGFKKRVGENLDLVMPELSEVERSAIYRGTAENAGRTMIETYAHDDLEDICADIDLSGEGWDRIEAARRDGKPIIFVSGHFGNYMAVVLALRARGYHIGSVYRPFSNRHYDAHYRAALERIGPTFARGSNDMAQMVRFLKSGHHVAMAADQHFSSGADLTFFGHPAKSATAAARMALKYDALLVPVYGVRREDGVHFDVVIEPPVAKGTPEEMTQALNDSLEAIIRKHPDQWLWTHRRWR